MISISIFKNAFPFCVSILQHRWHVTLRTAKPVTTNVHSAKMIGAGNLAPSLKGQYMPTGPIQFRRGLVSDVHEEILLIGVSIITIRPINRWVGVGCLGLLANEWFDWGVAYFDFRLLLTWQRKQPIDMTKRRTPAGRSFNHRSKAWLALTWPAYWPVCGLPTVSCMFHKNALWCGK